MKVLRITLTKSPEAEGGFCMAEGETIELFDGGFRNPAVNASYYPVFGPYSMMQQLAEQILAGTNPQAADMFTAEDVTDTVNPPLEHDIMDEAGGMKVCTISHKTLMVCLKNQTITRDRKSETEDVFRISNTQFQEDVCMYDISKVEA